MDNDLDNYEYAEMVHKWQYSHTDTATHYINELDETKPMVVATLSADIYYNRYEDESEVRNISWDRNEFTYVENQIIEDYIKKNKQKVLDSFN